VSAREARAVLRRAALPEDLLSRDNASLSTEEYFRFWVAVEAEVGSATFSILLGEQLESESFHPVLFAALCSKDFATAARRIAQYKRLVCPMELQVSEDSSSLSIAFEWIDTKATPPPSLVAFELVFFVQLIRRATREQVRPQRVQTRVALTPALDYKQFFGVRPQASEVHGVSFSRADAYRPFLTANEGMWRVFEPALRRRLADLDASASCEDRLRAALLEGLPAGASSMATTAAQLGVSTRTLQRRLHDEGTSFQAVLDAVREELALHYLQKTKLSGAEISYLLGFRDPNSFFRAFHGWTGHTAEQARHTN